MKKNALIFIVLMFVSCKSSQYLKQYTQKDNIIIEGQGIDSFKVGATTINEVTKILGKDYSKVKHINYSVEHYYEKLGFSFFHYQKESDKIIFAINVKPPFIGKTSNGIQLNTSTIEDAIKVYGEPNWVSCNNCDTWKIQYPGIEFSVERDTSLVHFPLDEAAHISKKIIEISIKE